MKALGLVKYLLLSTVWFSFSVFSAPEIWLLSGKDCNICELFDEVKQKRGYGEELLVAGKRYPIRHVDKSSLPDFLTLAIGDGVDSRHWPLQLTVAIVDNETLLYYGNIAQSADFSQAFLNKEYMKPRREVPLEELHDYGFNYLEFFRQQFNLEYFVNVALYGATPHKDNALTIKLSSDFQKNQANLSIWGSAMQPAANGLFISTRINQLQSKLENHDPLVIFAHGKDAEAMDTLTLKDDKYTFVKAPVKADFAADLDGLQDWFSTIKNSEKNNHLIVQVGHSGPNGSPVWGHSLPLDKPLLQSTIEKTGKDTVLVSGSCHSGLFAGAASCGFYAAHPEAIATGCQTSLSAIEASDDYLKFFFSDDKQRDLNNDEKVTFNEAHWYASSRLEHHNISYTDTDAIIDDYFLKHPESLGQGISLQKLKGLKGLLSPQEQYALNNMADGLSGETKIDLTDHVAQHKSAIKALEGKTELSSVKRNKVTALNYPLNLVILARRALYKELNMSLSNDLSNCENRDILDFVK